MCDLSHMRWLCLMFVATSAGAHEGPLALTALRTAQPCLAPIEDDFSLLDWYALQPAAFLMSQVRVRRRLAQCRAELEAAYSAPPDAPGAFVEDSPQLGKRLVDFVVLDRLRAFRDGEAPALQAERGLRTLALLALDEAAPARVPGMSVARSMVHGGLLKLWPFFAEAPPEVAWQAWLAVEALLDAHPEVDGPSMPDDQRLIDAARRGDPSPATFEMSARGRAHALRLTAAGRRLMRLALAARRAHAAGQWPIEPAELHPFGGPGPAVLAAAFSRVELVGPEGPRAVVGKLAFPSIESPFWPQLAGLHTRWKGDDFEIVVCLGRAPECEPPVPTPGRWIEERAELLDLTAEMSAALRAAGGDFAAAGFEVEHVEAAWAWRWEVGDWAIRVQVSPYGSGDIMPSVDFLYRGRGYDVDLRAVLRSAPIARERAQALQDQVSRDRPLDPEGDFFVEEGTNARADGVRWPVEQGMYFRDAQDAHAWELWWGRHLPELMPAVLEEIFGDEVIFGDIVRAALR